MRLLTHQLDGEERLAAVIHGTDAIDVADLLPGGPWTMARLLTDVSSTIGPVRTALEHASGDRARPLESLRLLAPITRPGAVIAVGRNYREHAAEESAALPAAPLLFAKLPTAVVGDGAAITWRAGLTSEVDYEAELAVVIGREARDVPPERALEHVLGYTCLDDVSARDLQTRDGQWTRAKSLDTFCPMGPWLVTSDELPNPDSLGIRCRVNGELRQDATTADLVHGVAQLVAYCSTSFTLRPGDVIATGTPGGVGAFRDPPVYLADGDIVEVEIDGIGTLRNRCTVVA
jgi:2-keto-4-pentenoate hydratase/2-oxohepta-3-ene-1,7-dioic acid hydratase in catechol pathway